jgi:hypothetical protein
MNIGDQYEMSLELTGEPVSAAIITYLYFLKSKKENPIQATGDLSHEICMGIRHGLFGNESNDETSIGDGLSLIAGAIARKKKVHL